MIKLVTYVALVFLWKNHGAAQHPPAENQGDQLLKVASQLIAKEKLNLAKNVLFQARSKGANPVLVRYNLGYIHYQQKNFVQAIKDFQFCIQNAPAFRNVYQSLSLLYNSLDLQHKGIQVLEDYMKHNGEDPSLYVLMGDLYHQMESYPEADRCYQDSLKLDATQDLPYLSSANLYMSLGDFARALHVVELGIPIVKNPTELLLKKADILVSLEKFIEAAGICSLILDMYPPEDEQKRYNLMYAMASFYLDAGLDMLSIDILKECIQQFPHSAGVALDLLEYTFLESGLYVQAMEFYDQFFEKNRQKVYTLVRRLFQKVFQEQNQIALENVLRFYEKYKLRDDIYPLVKEASNVLKVEK